jgi:hypothetical protein
MKMVVAVLVILAMTLTLSAADKIVINEIMYNSQGTDVEFIELVNVSGSSINLAGWSILDDNDAHVKCQLSGTLAANAYIVVVGDKAAFGAVYPDVQNVNANDYDPNGTGWSLGNNGDTVRLFENNVVHDSVNYNDGGGWPTSPDGNGPSLELLHPSLDNNEISSWDPSQSDGGTPGKQNSVYTTNVMPVCKDGERHTNLPKSSDNVRVTVLAYDQEGLAKVELMVDAGTGFQTIAMYDDGSNGDAVAGDSLFTGTIPPKASGTLVKYYAMATDLIGQTDNWPNDAPTEYHAYTVDYTPPDLRITELMAVNNTTKMDEAGEYDDWFEIHNAGTVAVNLKDMYVSNALNSTKTFKLPNYILAAGAYVLLWADDDQEQGPLHTNFRLSADGESVALFETINHGNVLVHGWKYGRMGADVSMGFVSKDATAPDYLKIPTPGTANNPAYYFDLCINEFQSTSDFGGPDDWIEIYNRGSQAVDVSNYFLSDERGNNDKWQFPNDTIMQPGQYLVIWEDELKFGLSSEGIDVIMFTKPDTVTGVDFYDFGAQRADYSEGRCPDGTSTWQNFKPPSRGAANDCSAAVVQDENPTLPDEFVLQQNYPNPFNPTTTIAFTLPQADNVTLKIYDILGREITTLVNQKMRAGAYSFDWNAENFSSGVYLYTLTVGDKVDIKKMQLLK